MRTNLQEKPREMITACEHLRNLLSKQPKPDGGTPNASGLIIGSGGINALLSFGMWPNTYTKDTNAILRANVACSEGLFLDPDNKNAYVPSNNTA